MGSDNMMMTRTSTLRKRKNKMKKIEDQRGRSYSVLVESPSLWHFDDIPRYGRRTNGIWKYLHHLGFLSNIGIMCDRMKTFAMWSTRKDNDIAKRRSSSFFDNSNDMSFVVVYRTPMLSSTISYILKLLSYKRQQLLFIGQLFDNSFYLWTTLSFT